MALETERKYLGVDFAVLRRALAAAGAEDLGTHFESNVVVDTPELSLLSSNRVLRVRSQEWAGLTRYLLTLKLPVAGADRGYKTREERELGVESAETMLALLAGLGFTESARYEKVRSVWRLAWGGAQSEILIELDELPFGRAVELEGPPEALVGVASLLGLDKYEISTKSYHALHQEWRSDRGLAPERSFVFGPEERRKHRRRLGLPAGTGAPF